MPTPVLLNCVSSFPECYRQKVKYPWHSDFKFKFEFHFYLDLDLSPVGPFNPETELMTTDKRHFSRIFFISKAHLELGAHRVLCTVHDLSLKGALVELDQPLSEVFQIGGTCQLELVLDSDGDNISMTTEITHVEGQRIGLTCRSIDLDSITHLRRLVELNLGDSDLLNRELSALVARS